MLPPTPVLRRSGDDADETRVGDEGDIRGVEEGDDEIIGDMEEEEEEEEDEEGMRRRRRT